MMKVKLTLIVILIILNNAAAEKVRVVELINSWTLRNQSGPAVIDVPKIPSGVYTAVSSLYGDVLQSKNDVALRWIAYENWTYTKTFNVNQADYEHVRSVNLTLHGVDTIATIRLNDVVIGRTNNMFVRYSFNVLPYLKQENTLEIEIMSPVLAAKQLADSFAAKNISTPPKCAYSAQDLQRGECHRNMLRKMQASFGGDWNVAVPSMGLWKTVALEYYDVAIMRNIDVSLHKNSSHWIMDVRVFLSSGSDRNFYGNLTFFAPELIPDPIEISKSFIQYTSRIIEFTVGVPIDKVLLWWPNGYGAQKLYPLFFSMNCWLEPEGVTLRSKSISQKALNIGFRTLELIEDVDAYGRTFYFKVNNHPIFIKGASYMPVHILPELAQDQERINHILSSAKESNMNMLRVWGGGLYESDYFYSMADYYGLLIWQDMAFTTSTYPLQDDFVESVRLETARNAKRIAYHPSLALIVTNDEVELYLVKNDSDFGQDAKRLEDEYKQLFMGTIKYELNIIERNAYSVRPGPMISTPSMGIEMSKKDLPLDPQNLNYGDIHFWELTKDAWSPDIYPAARFVSEYGFQSLPIMATWSRTLGRNDTILDLVHHRQRDDFGPMIELIKQHLPIPENWEYNIEALIYFSQIVQAMAVKTATEVFRSRRDSYRTMGALYWHLNDVWVAPTWSSIDFYGNYKLLYYWSKQFLAPTAIIALHDAKNGNINVTFMRDDVTESVDTRIYDITINTYLWSELYSKQTKTRQATLKTNSLQQIFLSLDSFFVKPFNESNSFLEFILSQSGNMLSTTFYIPGTIKNAIGLQDPQLTFELSTPYCNSVITSYSITILIKYPALFVYIEINHPNVEKYKLSDNGFIQTVPVKTVQLQIEKFQCKTISKDYIKILTVNQFMSDNAGKDENQPLTTTTSTISATTTTTLTTSSVATATTSTTSTTAMTTDTTLQPLTTLKPN